MSLYKRRGEKSDVWWFHFQFKGHHIQQSTYVSNKRDAETIERAYRTQLAKGEVGIEAPEEAAPIPKFNEALKLFLEWSEGKYAAHPASHRRYQVASAALLRYFGTVPLDRIALADVEEFKAWRAKQKTAPRGKKSKKPAKAGKQLRPATVNREVACLKHLFSWFIKNNDGVLSKNPVVGVEKLDEDNKQMRVLNSEEEALYLLAASQPLQDIATMMLETGMRPEEVCRIRRENVHIEQGYVFNPYGKTKAAKRKVPLSDRVLAVLLKRLNECKGVYLFPGGRVDDDAPIVKVNAAHTATVTRCGVAHFRLYDLRHTWATRSAQAGVDLVTLATLLGHSGIQMVMRYAHPTEEHQFAAMEKLQRYMAR